MKNNARKSGSGGARPGSGKKSAIPAPDGEVKAYTTVGIYPTHLTALVEKYGSLQKAIDAFVLQVTQPAPSSEK